MQWTKTLDLKGDYQTLIQTEKMSGRDLLLLLEMDQWEEMGFNKKIDILRIKKSLSEVVGHQIL